MAGALFPWSIFNAIKEYSNEHANEEQRDSEEEEPCPAREILSLLQRGLVLADGGCAVCAPSPHGVCPDEGLPLGSPPRGLYPHGVADRSLRGENGVAQHEGVALMGDKPHGVAHDFHSFRAVRSGRNHGLRSTARDEEEEEKIDGRFHGCVC